ncbi:MAG: tail fiber domain-containing protein [SAR324 cluster bacterium]|nr:tail fiber domain-containing protein [SAR324 cluster bacterium]
MKRFIFITIITVFITPTMSWAQSTPSSISVPYTFSSGSVISAGQMNQNFSSIYTLANSLIGTLAVSSNSVGIGTSNSTARLEVRGVGNSSATSALNVTDSNGVSMFSVRDDGNVGIGTANPDWRFSIVNGDSSFKFGDASHTGFEMRHDTGGMPYLDFINDSSTDFDMRIQLTGDDSMLIEGGNLGIGTTTPTATLSIAASGNTSNDTAFQIVDTGPNAIMTVLGSGDVTFTGNLTLPNSTASAGIIYTATDRFLHNYGTSNTFLGKNAGNLTLSGALQNTAVGEDALMAVADGDFNVALGYSSLRANASGSNNTASGWNSLWANTGSRNTALGSKTLYSHQTGNFNTAVGSEALLQNTTGAKNTAIGDSAGYNALGTGNVFIGYKAGYNETGSDKLYIGTDAATKPLIYGDFSTGKLGFGTSNPLSTLHIHESDTNTNTVVRPLSIAHTLTSGTAASGIGVGMSFFSENDGGAQTEIARIDAALVDASSGSEQGRLDFYTSSTNSFTTPTLSIGSTSVGIGTTGNQLRLHIKGDSNEPSTSGNVANGGILLQSNGTFGLAIGTYDSGSEQYGWLQSQYVDNANSTEPLALNPLGGNVGIGTTTSSTKLHLYENNSSTIPQIRIEQDGSGDAAISFDIIADAGGRTWTMGGDRSNFDFTISGSTTLGSTPYLVIDDNTGNVGIGTTIPTATLSVSGSLSISSTSNSSGSIPFQIVDTGPNALVIVLGNGNVGIGTSSPDDALDVVGDIDATGCFQNNNSGTIGGTCVSDFRLKQDIEPLSGSLDKILRLNPVHFQWREKLQHISKETGSSIGLIAQEVEEVFPHLVKTGEDGYKRVTYNIELQMHTIQAIKELKEENDALKMKYEQMVTRQKHQLQIQEQEMGALKAMVQQMAGQMAHMNQAMKVLEAKRAAASQPARPQKTALVQ